jgi:hypothetical protein
VLETQPSDSVVLERARSLADDCCWMVALQVRRLQTVEPEDADFLSRQMADFQFLIVALTRLRKAALVAQSVPAVSRQVTSAIAAFDAALPGMSKMRNVGEHVEDYALDSARRHDKTVDRRMLQVAGWDENTFTWLGEQLSVAAVQPAARELYLALKDAQQSAVGTDER